VIVFLFISLASLSFLVLKNKRGIISTMEKIEQLKTVLQERSDLGRTENRNGGNLIEEMEYENLIAGHYEDFSNETGNKILDVDLGKPEEGYQSKEDELVDVSSDDNEIQDESSAFLEEKGVEGSNNLDSDKSFAETQILLALQEQPLYRPEKFSNVKMVCGDDYYSCSDFELFEEAQWVFEECGGPENDIHKLDTDNDGLVCELLKSEIFDFSIHPNTGWFFVGDEYTCCSEERICNCQLEEYRDYSRETSLMSYIPGERKTRIYNCVKCEGNKLCEVNESSELPSASCADRCKKTDISCPINDICVNCNSFDGIVNNEYRDYYCWRLVSNEFICKYSIVE